MALSVEEKLDELIRLTNQIYRSFGGASNLPKTEMINKITNTNVSESTSKSAASHRTETESAIAVTNTEAEIEMSVNKLDEIPLENHFAVRQLPPNLPKADAMKVVKKIGKHLGFHFEAEDLSNPPFVVPHTNKKTSSVIGAFSDLRKKQEIFSKYEEKTVTGDPRLLEPIMVEDICIGLPADSTMRGIEILLENLTQLELNRLNHTQQAEEGTSQPGKKKK